MNKQEALSAIRWDVSGFAVGLLLGALAFWLVRPKSRAASAFDMAQRWLSWGVFAGFTSGTMFYFRNYDQGGIVGAVIGIVFWSGLSWFLGFLWGLVRLGGSHRPLIENSVSQPAASAGKSSPLPAIGAVVTAAFLLGLVGLSLVKNRQSQPLPDGEVVQRSPSDPSHVASGFLMPDSESLDLDAIVAAAKQGNARAKYLLAMRLFFDGDDFFNKQEPNPYRPWSLGRAGEPPSLRYAHNSGRLTSSAQNRQDAIELLKQAAADSDALAQVALMECYLEGVLLQPDIKQAHYWSRRAVNSSEPEALLFLAFSQGQDPETKIHLLHRLASAGHPVAQRAMARMHESAARQSARRLLISQSKLAEPMFGPNVDLIALTPGYKKLPSFSVDFDHSNTDLSSRLSTLQSEHPEAAEALRLIRAAASKPYPPAQLDAASMLIATPATQDEAAQYLRTAAAAGYYPAILDIMSLCSSDDYPFKDLSEALKWGYVARMHPHAPSMPKPSQGVSDEFASRMAESSTEWFREFNARIEALEARLSPSEKKVALSEAAAVTTAYMASGNVWLQVDKHDYWF